MKSLPTQERAIKKRLALVKAAGEEFAMVGFEQATAKSIAAKAGVATGTFYQYFENKNDILCVVAENRFADLYQQVSLLDAPEMGAVEGEALRDLFERSLHFTYQYHLRDGLLHQAMDQCRRADSRLDGIMIRGEARIRSHVFSFTQGVKVEEPELVAEALFAMAEGLVHDMVFGKKPEQPERMLAIGADMLASYFTRSINA